MFYPALLGAALGYGLALALNDTPGVQLMALATGLPVTCLLSVATGLLAFVLPWIAPALTAATIARERELGTLDLLRVTLLSERSIVLGKLGGCLARLWPGILTLALLIPFQIVGIAGSGLLSGSSPLYLMLEDGLELGTSWAWLVLISVPGLLRPWCDLALNAAIGLFVSALSRSSGVAIAVSYAAILVTRVSLWLITSILWPLLLILLNTNAAQAPSEATMALTVFGLLPLAKMLAEILGTVALIRGAIWGLERM